MEELDALHRRSILIDLVCDIQPKVLVVGPLFQLQAFVGHDGSQPTVKKPVKSFDITGNQIKQGMENVLPTRIELASQE